jgi:hypothetical protein
VIITAVPELIPATRIRTRRKIHRISKRFDSTNI